MEHGEFYKLPEVYELAFSYRNVPHECDFLAAVYQSVAGRQPSSVLELACGPGEHVREFQRRDLRVAALDLSAEMTAYLQANLAPDRVAEVLTADMAEFKLQQKVDLAFTLIDSLPYLTTNAQLISHFRCVRQSLEPGGVYVVELRHPRDILGGDQTKSTVNKWTMESGGLSVMTEWGVETHCNPITQVEHVLTRITIERDGRQETIETRGDLRPLLPQELLALVELAGGWQFAGWWGDFDLARPLGEDDRDWRMIVAVRAAV